jgi:archaeosine synthase beta-subunit
VSASYPLEAARRDRWILERRGIRNALDPRRPHSQVHEIEPDESLRPVPISTIFLTNRECPWRCLMCDLWRNTLTEPVARGAIAEQISYALGRLPPARWVKLYNSGSFFDAKAIPPEDFPAIAEAVSGFERVIVESHPALVGRSSLVFRDAIEGSLDVAMGLETIHPEVLPRLNKRMTLEQFRRAAGFLADAGITVRVFVLVGLPLLAAAEAADWACRSVAFAFDSGASVVSLIPTRSGNGAMDALERRGEFSPPPIAALEEALARALSFRRGRVLADLWDLERFNRCEACFGARKRRLETMNRTQARPPGIACAACAGSG